MNYKITDVDILEGSVPSDINGVFFRNGPNLKYMQKSGRSHWFEGDGMIHAIKLKDGKAQYCNKYQRTPRLMKEFEA